MSVMQLRCLHVKNPGVQKCHYCGKCGDGACACCGSAHIYESTEGMALKPICCRCIGKGCCL